MLTVVRSRFENLLPTGLFVKDTCKHEGETELRLQQNTGPSAGLTVEMSSSRSLASNVF